jgi:3-dehydrosphinganine reductase
MWSFGVLFGYVGYVLICLFSIMTIYSLIDLVVFKWRSRSILTRLNGLHVLITGGSQGIGKSIADLCCRHGANVTLFARDPVKLNDTKAELVSNRLHRKQKFNCFSVDVTNQDQINETIDFMGKHFDPVDLLINCAGTSIAESAEQTSIDTFDRMMAVNYFGSVYTSKAFISLMKDQGRGHIALVSSVAGLFGMYGYSAYSASKFALIGFAQSLHMELKEHGIKVTVVLPPDTDTPGFEQEQIGKVGLT